MSCRGGLHVSGMSAVILYPINTRYLGHKGSSKGYLGVLVNPDP